MNAKAIEALRGIRDNLTILIEEMENSTCKVAEEVTAEAITEVKEPEEPQTEEITEPEIAETPEIPETPAKTSRKEREASEKLPDHTSDEITQEQLEGLSYNNLKRLAKEMGIPAVGSRDELTQKILNFDGAEVSNSDEEVVETEVEVAPAKSPRTTNSVSKKAEVAEDASDDGDEDEEVDPLVQKVHEAVEDMTDEEIMDILADVGVKAKGKRQALISAVIKAVHDGKIDLDDEEESEEVDESESVEDSEEETEYGVNDLENPDMTEERKAAIEAYVADTRADFKSGDLTRKQLVEWLNDFYGSKDSMKKKSDDEVLDEYIDCSCLLINDEGEMPEEEGAYTVNGVPYCCGHELAYNEDNETYICEVCGAEYEAGEE